MEPHVLLLVTSSRQRNKTIPKYPLSFCIPFPFHADHCIQNKMVRRRFDWLTVLVTVVIVSTQLPIVTQSAPIQLNIKSSLLSHYLKAVDSSNNNTTTNNKSLVGLDLSGNYECWLWGHGKHRQRTPLFLNIQTPYALAVGIHYNFAHAWYGATKVLSRIQWNRNKNTNSNTNTNAETNLLPAMMELTTKYDLSRQKTETTIALQWNKDQSASIRIEPSSGRAQCLLQYPLHTRLLLQYQSNLWFKEETVASLGYYNHRIPNRQDWLPDVTLGTSGILSSNHNIALGRLGLRLMWSRSFGVFGVDKITDDDDDATTKLQLQLSSIDQYGQQCTSIQLDTTVEHPMESLHFCILLESVRSGHR